VPVDAVVDNRFNGFANACDRDAVAAFAQALG
jgi:hypothetical protein